MKSLSNTYYKTIKYFFFVLSISVVTELEALQGMHDILSHRRKGMELNVRYREGENG